MSQSETPSEAATEEELKQYRSTSGTETKTADVPNDDHDLKDVIGDDEEAKERKYDPALAGERFVNFYDDTAAGLREFLSNAETACIDRCEAELEEAGYEVPDSVAETIQKAKEKTGYEPVIEVTYNRDPNATTLVIEDNGIGISRKRYQVLQRVGYSTSHDDGGSAGQFGIGFLAGFLLCGVHEGFDLITHSFEDEAQYHTVEFLNNFEYGSGKRKQGYGTRFEFNTFCHDAKQNVNVPNAVQRFAEGMRVPVIYTDYDESGTETSRSDDYTPRNIENDYPDDALVITYEDDFVKAVMSPASSNTRGRTTYNVIMPIRRNLDTYKTKCGAPWEWDVRVKVEDGSIVHVPDDADLPDSVDSADELIGLSPVKNQKYHGLTEHQKEDAIKLSEVPDGAITAPRPASSRDSFKSGNDDFWQYVGDKLAEQWKQEAASMLDSLDSFDDYVALDASDKSLVNRAYSDYGPKTTRSDNEDDKSRAETINEALEDNLGVTLDKDVAVKLDQLKYKTRLVPRDTDEPRLKGNSHEEKVWKIIDKAGGDDVYMGKSITDKKAEIAWGLSDSTQVVRVEDYGKWEDLFGWKKLKDLPSRNLEEKLPELDDDVIDRWNNVTQSNKTSGSGSKRTSRDPTTKRIKVRCDTGDSNYYDTYQAGKVYDKLDNGKEVSCGYWSKHSATALIIFDQNETSRAWTVANAANYKRNVAAAKMPTYVYDYLKQADNVYESKEEYKRECARETITLGDGSTKRLCDLTENDLLLVTSDAFADEYDDAKQLVTEQVAERTGFVDADDVETTTYVQSSNVRANLYGFEQTDATIVRLSNADTSRYVRRQCNDKVSLNKGTLVLETELPDADFDAPEFDYIFESETPKDTDTFRKVVQMVKNAGGEFPSQDE